jgi:PAS domain S-box-containing protein
MTPAEPTRAELARENDRLRARLAETEQALRAARAGRGEAPPQAGPAASDDPAALGVATETIEKLRRRERELIESRRAAMNLMEDAEQTRRRAERANEALAHSRQALERAQEIGRIGSWRMDVARNVLTWSAENHRIFGIPEGTPMTYETFLASVHPDDAEYVDAKWKAALTGAPYDIEHRILVNGEVKWVRERAYLEFNEDGELATGFGITQDITDRKIAEEALRRSERRYRTLAANLPGGAAFILDRDLRYVLAEGEALEKVGLASADLEGKTLGEALEPNLVEYYEPMYRQALAGEGFQHEHFSHERWYVSRGVPLHDSAGNVTGVLAMSYDITDRKEAEQALMELNEQLEQRVQERTAELQRTLEQLQGEVVERIEAQRRAQGERDRLFSLLNRLPGYVVLKDSDYNLRFASHGFVDAFGQPQGRPCHQLQYGLDEPCDDCPMGDVLDRGRSLDWEHTYPNGVTYHIWAFPFADPEGEDLLLELGVDVTERKKLELLVSEMSETERRRFGRDLHDTLGQQMTGLSFLVGSLADRLAESAPAEQKAAEDVVERINEATSQMRSLAHGLDPVGLKAQGLPAALREMADDFEAAHGVPCRFHTHGKIDLDEFTSTHLYRIAQEAINNAAKHARAGQIAVSLTGTDEALVLRVADDGVGLPEDLADSEGMGMSIMRYRAGAIGAQLRVRSGKGGGTVITCLMLHEGSKQ